MSPIGTFETSGNVGFAVAIGGYTGHDAATRKSVVRDPEPTSAELKIPQRNEPRT
jgi:hypothetical protein